MRKICVIAHDMRSTHNVGSLLRTAEGLGVEKIFLTGYTPHPSTTNDPRLPHIVRKQEKDISKTALGADKTIKWEYNQEVNNVISKLKEEGYLIVALEQTKRASELHTFKAPDKVALILGTEVTGLPKNILELTDRHLYIPMFGSKESFNVVQAAAMAMYSLRFY